MQSSSHLLSWLRKPWKERCSERIRFPGKSCPKRSLLLETNPRSGWSLPSNWNRRSDRSFQLETTRSRVFLSPIAVIISVCIIIEIRIVLRCFFNGTPVQAQEHRLGSVPACDGFHNRYKYLKRHIAVFPMLRESFQRSQSRDNPFHTDH